MSNNVAVAADTEQRAKYYGGTITVQGRNLITSLLVGETLEFTRIVVGSGLIPEGIEPIDMTDLVSPEALATSTVPVVENNVLSMTVEYRNDMNGGLKKGFWLREFGVFAKTADTEEILLYYATLGDSPQPVNAYIDNRVDIRRYPVTVALELDAELQVTYSPGSFITAGEAQDLIEGMVKSTLPGSAEIVIPADGWKEQLTEPWSAEYPYAIDVVCEQSKEILFPHVALDIPSLRVAKIAGLCPTIETLDGLVRFWAMEVPEADLIATVLFAHSGGDVTTGEMVGSKYVLPAATNTTLGGIKGSDTIVIDEDGTAHAIATKISEDNLATDEEVDSALDNIFGEHSVPDDSTPSGEGIASDEEVEKMLNDIFGASR